MCDLSRKVFKMPGTSKITVRGRAQAYPQDLYADKNQLFCKSCCVGLELKLSTLKSHINSPKHAKAKKESIRRIQESPKERQITLKAAEEQGVRRSEFTEDFVRMCLLSNIPLEKTELMSPFFGNIAVKAEQLLQEKTSAIIMFLLQKNSVKQLIT